MVEIKHFGRLIDKIIIRQLIFALVLMFFVPSLLAQETKVKPATRKMVELLNADTVNILRDPQTGKDYHHLLGHIRFKDNDVLMWSDSAHYFPDRNQLIAYSRVHIQQGDTLNLFGDNLFYDGKNQMAYVKGNVVLVNKDTHLYTDSINYNVTDRIARYNHKGRITNSDNTLTSIVGVYYVQKDLFHFKDSVKIVNPKYVMTADTMDYNTTTKIAYFTGPTELKGDSLYLFCEKGWYDTQKEITSVWKKALINNGKQIVHGDSLYYNDSTGYGEGYMNVVIEDTINKLVIQGDYAWYYKNPERFLVTKKAMFVQISNEDSLFLHSDTISSITAQDKSLKVYRLMRAYHGCRIFSKDLQAKCDSLSYSFQDSVIRLYRLPVIWSKENQLTSDSMAVFTKNRQTDRLELYNSAFIVSQIDTIRYNQIKGRSLTGHFKNNELYKINIKGNGESLYYLLDGDLVAGRNESKCANMEVLIDRGKISDIYEYDNPEGFIDPPLPADPIRLDGFKWLDHFRPKRKLDIFNK